MNTNDAFSLIRPCKACRDALQVENDVVAVHGTLESFLTSVSEKCHFCHTLYLQLPVKHQRHLSITSSTNIYKIQRTHDSSFSMAEDLLVPYYSSSNDAVAPPSMPAVSFHRNHTKPPRAFGSLWGNFRFNLFVMLPVEWRAHCAVWNEEILRAGGRSPLKAMLAANPALQLWPLPEDMAHKEDASTPGVVNSSSTDSDETFSKIRSWLDKCEKHETCRQRREADDPLWLPTRLKIETEPDSTSPSGISPPSTTNLKKSNIKCRIVEPNKTQPPQQDTTYITLSHRWPNDASLVAKLSTANLEAWKTRLPLESLSQTFCDAFAAAVKLNVSYVWIDSLCIIQEGADARADWEAEARMMHRVYSRAKFNLYAARGGVLDGMFSRRDPEQLVLRRAYLDSQSGAPLTPESLVDNNDDQDDKDAEESNRIPISAAYDDKKGALRPFKHLYSRHVFATTDKPGELWQAKIHESPLATRGWIFQEQLLSLATIHFGRDEVLFECREMRASESLGTEEDYAVKVSSWGANGYKKTLPLDKSDTAGSFGQGGAYRCWYNLLGEYSARQLTKLEDRLVAMSGVAQHFKGLVLDDDVYIAGLWSSRLATDLLWRHTKGASLDVWEGLSSHWDRPYRSFSFSWISVLSSIEQPVLFPVWFKYTANVECIRYRTGCGSDGIGGVIEEKPFKEDIFSLQPAPPAIEIKVTGHLRQMSLVVSPSMSVSSDNGRSACPDDFVEETDLHLILGQYATMPSESLCIKGDARLDFRIGIQDLTALNEAGNLFLMPIVSQDRARCRTWLLLLVLVDAATGRFRRIGVHEGGIWPERQQKELAEWLFTEGPPTSWKGPWTCLRDLPCWRYCETEKQHTIFII